MRAPAKIIGKMRRGAERIAYGNPLYQKMLASGEAPDRLYFTPPDLWPGDAQAGMAIIAAQAAAQNAQGNDGVLFARPQAVMRVPIAIQLRNLRAVGTDIARQAALVLIESGMAQGATWNERDWSPQRIGARSAAWIGFYEFYAPVASSALLAKLTEHLHRQWKHLTRAVPAATTGMGGLDILRGIVYGELNFAAHDEALSGYNRLGLACDLLKRQLAAELLPDGAHCSRNPSAQLRVLQQLLELRAAFTAADLPWPSEAAMAISAMAPVLKFYRHGDGALALFHGSREESALVIDATLTQAESKSRMPRRLTHGGFERVTAGRSLLIADCGRPPDEMWRHGHAGIFAFEFGQGKERIIVNCGAYGTAQDDDRDAADDDNAESTKAQAWAAAMAATAAHSALTVADTNACDVLKDGGVRSSAASTAHRYEQDGAQGIEMRHDGYDAAFGIIHQRILELSGNGEELRGRDILENRGNPNAVGCPYTLRWHLHPGVTASLAQSGQAVLLRTASGAGWRLRVEGAELVIEAGIYCGVAGYGAAPRRTLQLKTTGATQGETTTVRWSLVREKK